MKGFLLRPLVAALALGFLMPLSDAFAQDDDRDNREERRALRASDFEEVNISEEYRRLAREKRHESMAFLKDILANRAPTGEQKAEMMLRLADLYFEEGRDIYLTEMQNYETEYDACFNAPGCNPENMLADNAESEKWQKKSIKLYKSILQNYPQYARADEATFYLASALQELDKADDAVKEFTRLVRTYPESGYVPDAYVQIGEYYFDNNNAYKALLAYQKATRYKDSNEYSFAMYKLAWCYYNVGEYGKAIDTMKAVVSYSMTAQEGSSEQKRLTLQDEALKDLVRFFADAGEMDEAYTYFNKLGKKNLIRSMLKRLATTYFEQGKFEECIQTYRRLIAEDPQSSDAPDYQNEIITAYQKIGRKQETLNEIDRMLKTYGRNSPWARANSADPDALKAAEDYIEKTLRRVALNFHAEAKKHGQGSLARETYTLAEQAYSVYLQEFPEGKNTYEMRYAYGELLYKLKKFDGAYEQYMAVVKLDPNGKRSKFCANSAVYSAQKMSDSNPGETPVKGSRDSVAMSDWDQKYLTALDQYSGLYPDDKDTPGAIYKAGYLLYNHNMFKESSERFRTVIAMQPGSRDAETAANLILDALVVVEDWESLRDVSKAFFDQEGLGRQSFKDEVFTIYENASFKLIEVNFGQDKDEKKAADAYMSFVTDFPGSKSGDLGLNNAAVYYYNTENYKDAMTARHRLIDEYPESKYYKSQIAELGFAYESIADFSTAAGYYEKLFSLDQDHEAAKDAMFSAGLYRKSLGEWEAAIDNFNKYITAWPDDDRVAGMTIDVASIYADNGKVNEAMRVFETFFETPPAGASVDQAFYARMQYGLLLEGKGSNPSKHWASTLAAYGTAKSSGQEIPLATEIAAQIMYKQASPTLSSYLEMAISGPGRSMSEKKTNEVLKDQLVGKAKSLLEVEGLYQNIVATGAGEWGLAAIIELGKAYDDMGVALTNSYIPDYLTEDQIELYQMGLEDKAYLQEEKAVEAYRLALEKSFELNLYNNNTAYATRRLGELRPGEFPQLTEELMEATYTSSSRSDRSFLTQP
jgi:tetratricopeptide (TPR) repeat protein